MAVSTIKRVAASDVGALPLSGGTMTGTLDMGQASASGAARAVQWTTADGTVFQIRPYNNLMQLTMRPEGGATHNVFGFGSNGTASTEYQAELRSAINAASLTDISQRIWAVQGIIVESGSGGTARGTGRAVLIVIGKTVIVDFEAQITTAGTSDDVYTVGISYATLKSLNSGIPAFTVSNGGIIHYYTSSGAINTTLEGFAGAATVNTSTNKWSFGRLYTAEGNVGAWSDGRFTSGLRITGRLYGQLT